MVKLPEIMAMNRRVLTELRVPEPTSDIGITMDATPGMIADKMLSVAGYLAFLEYLLGQYEAAHLTAKESVDYAYTIGLIGTDAKLALEAREATLLHESPTIQGELSYRVQQSALVEQAKGLRNAYRAQYDVLSRVLSAKQLEADVLR